LQQGSLRVFIRARDALKPFCCINSIGARIVPIADPIDESKFPYGYVSDHLKERVENWRSLSVGERIELTSELSRAAWEKIGVVYDTTRPIDETIRRAARKRS
jgi:hypothetical protein